MVQFKVGDIVIYVGKHLDYSEKTRIGQLGIVSTDFPQGEDTNVHVKWFAYPWPPNAVGGSVFPKNIEKVGHIDDY